MKFLPLSYNVDYLSNICVVLGGYAVILGRMTRIKHVVSMHISLRKKSIIISLHNMHTITTKNKLFNQVNNN